MTIRFRLTIGFIAVILVANFVLSLVMMRYVSDVWRSEVQTRVRLDLNSARAAYDNHAAGIERFLRAASLHRVIATGTGGENPEELAHRLQAVHREGGMDIISLLGPDGRVIYRARNPGVHGDDLSDNPVVAAALARREAVAGTVVLPTEVLQREGPDLADRAHFDLLPTPAARPTDEAERSDGMVMAAAAPVLSPTGKLVGVLYGADLLSRRYEIVDAIREEVFAGEVHGGRPIGTVTIFQGDLRISTNVATADGSRAVGTRLSEEVYDAVLVRGGVWDQRAFVVNDWYITAYEPIRDPAGRIVGVLYVGLLEAPFVQRERTILGVFVVMVTATTVASLVLLFIVTKLVLRPIDHIIAMSRRVIQGDLSARVGIRPPGEMGVLCETVNAIANAVAEREERLKLATRQQIGRSEQLASIGRLAAGVAHEINNPLTGVLTFAHLVRKKETLDEQDRRDMDLIIHETTRVAEIVRSLLDFARERPPKKESLDINDVIDRTVRLVRSQKQFHKVTIEERLADHLPPVYGDRNQLQQVLLNLSLNACEAMPDGGTLTIESSARDGQVVVAVIDTGCGIEASHLDQVFEPFFSTKPVGKGTGLGLSVSYGIVEQHGGSLEVESEPGKGTTFRAILPGETDAGGRVA